jgi:hypothetical protein
VEASARCHGILLLSAILTTVNHPPNRSAPVADCISPGGEGVVAMPFFTSPTSFRNANPGALMGRLAVQDPFGIFKKKLPPHASHPNFGHLILLVFEAVMEVVCVSLPGYVVAQRGMFDTDAQKFVANLNVTLFTPCLSMRLALFARRRTG